MMTPTFESLLVALSKNGVEFITVGGVAVAFSGYARSTYDLDLLVEDSAQNIERLLGVLSHFGSGSAKELTAQDFTREEGCIRVNENFPLDIFTLMNGNTYTHLLPHSNEITIENINIRYLGPRGLILLKQGSLRPKDKGDVEVLKKILEDQNG